MKRFGILGLALVLAIGISSCGQSQNAKSTETNASTEAKSQSVVAVDVSVSQFEALIKSKEEGILLDVRTPEEVAQVSIPGSVNMDFYASDFKEKLATLDKDKPVMVYCRSGKRSGNTMLLLKNMGFKEVYNLSGGMNAWLQQGLPTK